MALQKSFTENTGATYANAYHKVRFIDLFCSMPYITVDTYVDQSARNDNKRVILSKNYPISEIALADEFAGTNLNTSKTVLDNLKSMSYNYLKSLSDFEGASDV